MQINIEFCTYFGSQCAILKSKLNLVTNISLSNLTSWTLGGGSAIATPIKPITDDVLEDPDDSPDADEWCWVDEVVDEEDWLWELPEEFDFPFELS